MKCIYCKKLVYGKEGMTVPGKGSAHETCYQAYETSKRKFQGIDITELSDDELLELKELVLAEGNFRKRKNKDDDFELF